MNKGPQNIRIRLYLIIYPVKHEQKIRSAIHFKRANPRSMAKISIQEHMFSSVPILKNPWQRLRLGGVMLRIAEGWRTCEDL
jgi:hypothetical protein